MNKYILDAIDQKLRFVERPIIVISAFVFFGILIRMLYFPYGVPISLDGVDYFVYAVAIVQQGQFPSGILPTNNGWPTFLSVLFYVFNSPDMMNLMNLQRYASISISVLTVIPVYFLCKRFVNKSSALIGAALICFEPRIIQNSLLGLTEPLYIFLGSLTFALFLDNKIKMMYISSVVVALFSLVRYEGLLLFIPLSIIFFIRFSGTKRLILRYLLVVGIFILTMMPMAIIRIENTGQDGLTSHLFSGPQFVSKAVISGEPDFDDPIPGEDGTNKLGYFMTTSLTNLVKYLGWSMIPLFIFFLPFGFFKILKNREKKIILFLLTIATTLLIPAMYAYGRSIQEMRYLYIIFPLFCIISGYSTNKLENIPNKNIIFVSILFGIIVASIGFLEYEKIDYEDERERFITTRHIIDIADGVNDYKGNKYVKVATIEKNWPSLPELDTQRNRITFELKKIPSGNFTMLEKYIKSSKDRGLTHLVVEPKNGSPFLDDVFEHEEKYPYLHKEFDAKEYDFKNRIKIYKINYEIFDNSSEAK